MKKPMLIALSLSLMIPGVAWGVGAAQSLFNGAVVCALMADWKPAREHFQSRVAGPVTTKFVKDTLLEAGFPNDFIDSISIRHSDSFFATFKTIHVPFKEEVVRSLLANPDSYYWESRPLFYLYGQPGKNAIAMWKATIIHEAGHILHKDFRNGTISYFALMTGCELLSASYCAGKLSGWPIFIFNLSYCSSPKRLAIRALGLAVAVGIFNMYSRVREHRADQEIIKRVQDPRILETDAAALEDFGKQEELEAHTFMSKSPLHYIYGTIRNWFPSYPDSRDRAARMRKAAQKLRLQK